MRALRYITLRYIMLYYVTLCYITLCYVTLRYVLCLIHGGRASTSVSGAQEKLKDKLESLDKGLPERDLQLSLQLSCGSSWFSLLSLLVLFKSGTSLGTVFLQRRHSSAHKAHLSLYQWKTAFGI